MVSSGVLRRVALVRTDVSEELSASFIRVTRIGELGTTLAVTSNKSTLRRNNNFIVTAVKNLKSYIEHTMFRNWVSLRFRMRGGRQILCWVL
jgi:hypothetical protein